MPLYTIDVIEKNGWQVEVKDVRIFEDDKLIRMKKDHKFIESKKQKAVAFPDLGIFTVGCGEKKNTGKGAEGRPSCFATKRQCRTSQNSSICGIEVRYRQNKNKLAKGSTL